MRTASEIYCVKLSQGEYEAYRVTSFLSGAKQARRIGTFASSADVFHTYDAVKFRTSVAFEVERRSWKKIHADA